SDMRKPDGLVVVPPGTEAPFLAPLPVRRLWGVGPKMEERLLLAGIHTIGQLAAAPPSLERRFGTHGHDLLRLAQGLDSRPVLADPGEAKSVGAEHTYDQDTDDVTQIRKTLLRLADTVASRLRHSELRARTVTLKYRDETFRTLTRAQTLRSPTDSAMALFGAAWSAFGAVHGRRKVRLVGIYTSGFGVSQLELFAAQTDPVDRVRDQVVRKLGPGALTRASLLRNRR
ncbi:MAG: DNA polymerase IV, partial [Actinomycetota bacterium]|nr:DNA polymerase IV [Actinomycetota bacterium]